MKYGITNHAVQRYIDRVKPCHDSETAKRELQALVELAGEPHGKPDWYFLPDHATDSSELFLTLSDGIVVAVQGSLITTVIVRGTSCPQHRANKNAAKAKKQAKAKKMPYRPGRGKEALPRWR